MDFLVELGREDGVIRVGLRDRCRGRRLQRRLALGQFGLFAGFGVGHVVHRHLRLARILLVFLALFRAGLGLIVLVVVLPGAVGVAVVVLAVLGLILRLVLEIVGILAQLIAVAQILDHPPGQLGELALIGQRLLKIAELTAGLILDEPAPELHHIGRALRHLASGGEMADQIAGRHRKRCIRGLGDLVIAAFVGLGADLGVDIAGGAGHVARAHRLAAGGFHRLVELACHVARRRIAIVGRGVVVLVLERQRIRRAARQKHLVPGHPSADLRQPHGIARHARGVDGIRYRELGIVGHHLGGLGQRLLERICGIVGLRHGVPAVGIETAST